MFKYLYVITKNIINFYMLPQELPRFVLVVVKFQHCFQPPLPEPEVFVGGMRPWGCPQAIRWMILAPVKRWLEVTGDYRRIASSGKKLFTYHTMLHRFFPLLVFIHLYGLIFFLPASSLICFCCADSGVIQSLRCAHLLAHVITHVCRGDGLKDSRMGIAV